MATEFVIVTPRQTILQRCNCLLFLTALTKKTLGKLPKTKTQVPKYMSPPQLQHEVAVKKL